ncbi:hypothetical protein KTD31_03295 [Burkholderia multivorans]|uniref:hypothetical protein n=1 Tax=Burkholderia multivorans TaxID=87883 RepID=UPI001C241C8E|nr:hypothetical protein [Burkholderia multivorans]MBU9200378.1 hypothetical protein [Burkholderia multivorans]MDN8078497.1 hypothetical protein [Burkholderia multivorans]
MSDAIREKAEQHFSYRVDMAERLGGTPEAARREKDMGLRLLETALTLAPGEVLGLAGHFDDSLSREENFATAWNVLPYLCGALRLFELEFAHPELGVVPYEHVSQLLNGAQSVEYQGVTLTAKDVFVQCRRV